MDSPGLDAVLAQAVGAVPFAHVRRMSSLTATLDLADNVFLGIEPRRRFFGLPGIVDRAAMRTQAIALLRRVDVYTPLPTLASRLDDASRVLVEAARALAHGATVLAFTELTAGLTAAGAERVAQVLRRLANEGLAVVVASQRPSLAIELGDAVSVLSAGSIVPVLRPGDSGVDARGRLLEAMAGGAPGPAATGPTPRDRSAESPSGTVVEIVDWSTNDEFDRETPVVIDASLSAAAGEIVGVAGLEGSGRNELLLSVFGRTAGTVPSGAVLIDGLPVDTSTTMAAIEHGIFAIVTVQPKYRVRIVGGISAPATPSMLPALVKAGVVTREDEARSTPGARALDAVRLRGRDDEWVRIRSLLELFPESQHRVLLLVEPTRELDHERRAEVWRLLRVIADAGKAVIVTSADPDELLAISDRVVAMAGGRVVGEVGRGESSLELLTLVAPL
ncbi:ribose transport system ATP-binding protein/putative multiple sugar transport system ATP-binding protein [Agreia bicolorata]|uniref:Ribose transport system ATP-binding protein/putative multiple sugar transport system ATP-binding protein n=1 Tax=Agreia bicolorata TaxID=110935 RepID=A0A1T4WZW5_9MICO|nr:sugar ABC transporter ATP-binding protein [Agreia bicolorata]SKA82418.1 ribose transport system ATP-binding protein/putative multiple sugar transport system ATP-binding protein [Agreia bicolorata]